MFNINHANCGSSSRAAGSNGRIRMFMEPMYSANPSIPILIFNARNTIDNPTLQTQVTSARLRRCAHFLATSSFLSSIRSLATVYISLLGIFFALRLVIVNFCLYTLPDPNEFRLDVDHSSEYIDCGARLAYPLYLLVCNGM